MNDTKTSNLNIDQKERKKMEERNLVTRKVTMKTFIPTGETAKSLIGKGCIGRLMGKVNSLKTIETSYGECSAFLGKFMAQIPDGTNITGSKCFLPGEYAEELEQAVKSLEEGESVKFAYDIFIEENDREGSLGYKYVLNPLMEQKPVNFAEEFAGLAKMPALGISDKAGKKPAKKAKKK